MKSLMAVALMLLGCVGETTYVSPVSLFRADPCLDRGEEMRVDTFVVEVYQTPEGVDPGQLGGNCERCAESGCVLAHRSCECGRLSPGSAIAAEIALEGMEIELATTAPFCIRVLALRREPSPVGECACNEAWATPTLLERQGGLCERSRPATPSQSQASLRVNLVCPDDELDAFAQCIEPVVDTL